LKRILTLSFLRTVALAVVAAGALCSLGLVLNAGRKNSPVLLVILFAGWVLSPFVALLMTNRISKHWSDTARLSLYIFMIAVTLGPLVGYSGILSPPGMKPAAIFLIVPLISWVLIAVIIPIAAFLSHRNNKS
jgi:hypothetical protein